MATVVVCLDGTKQVLNQAHPTNVSKIFTALRGVTSEAGNGSFETAIEGGAGTGKYLPGVGTLANPILRVLGAAFGDGLAEPIVRGYTFLSRTWQPGDAIYIVGFGRGATAARALAGFVVSQGLLDPSGYDPGDKDSAYLRGIAAWYKYREPHPDLAQQARLTLISGAVGRSLPKLAMADFVVTPQIQAVGVFDTVSSLGLPDRDSDGDAAFDFSIRDTELSPRVLNGVHALSADECRDNYRPTFWSDRGGIVQHIFPGSHANVGGGCPERGLSDGALSWMLDQLENLGLPLDRTLILPPLAPNPLDVARDDGAIFPDNQTPRRVRAFPHCAVADGFLASRLGHGAEVTTDLGLKIYRPSGTYIDGSPLSGGQTEYVTHTGGGGKNELSAGSS